MCQRRGVVLEGGREQMALPRPRRPQDHPVLQVGAQGVGAWLPLQPWLVMFAAIVVLLGCSCARAPMQVQPAVLAVETDLGPRS